MKTKLEHTPIANIGITGTRKKKQTNKTDRQSIEFKEKLDRLTEAIKDSLACQHLLFSHCPLGSQLINEYNAMINEVDPEGDILPMDLFRDEVIAPI